MIREQAKEAVKSACEENKMFGTTGRSHEERERDSERVE